MPILSREEFEKQFGINPDGQQQPQATGGPKRMSQQEFQALIGGEYEVLPDYANGVSPESAINESPVSVEDRLKLSVGNEAGKINYLKQKFKAVQKTKSGDFVVQDQDGLWKRVDAEGLGDGDPWKMTMELAADVADVLPTAALIGAQVGAGVLTGGASLAVQAASAGAVGAGAKAIETVLGRAVGTYQASDEEMAKDIAVEALLNLGGTYVAAGVRPAAGYIAKGLKSGAKAVQKAPEASRAAVEKFMGFNVKGGEQVVSTFIDNADEASRLAAKYIQSGDPQTAFVNEAKPLLEEVVGSVKGSLSNFYGRVADEMVEQVGDGFKLPTRQLVSSIDDLFTQSGLTSVKNGKVVLKSFEEVGESVAGGQANPFSFSRDAYNSAVQLFESVNKLRAAPDFAGKVGAKNFIKLKQLFNDRTWELMQQADKQGLLPAKQLLAGVKSTIDDVAHKAFVAPKPVDVANGFLKVEKGNSLLQALDSRYNELSNAFKPLSQVVRSAEYAGPQAYFNAVDSIVANSGKKQGVKTAFDTASELISKFGGKEGARIGQNIQRIKVANSAAQFSPMFKPGLMGAVATQAGAASLLTGNVATGSALLATAVTGSPRINKEVIKGGIKTVNFMRQIGAAGMMNRLLSSPEAVASLVEAPFQYAGVQQQVGTELLNEGLNAIGMTPRGR